jgi:hypothetical protein
MARDHSQYLKKLDQQIKYIEVSCSEFDSGNEDEAIRIATSFRVIFHHKANSPSLIEHLDFSHKRMLSSTRGHNDWRDYVGFKLDLNSPTPTITFPLLADQWVEVAMDKWWAQETVFTYKGQPYSRRKIILSMANKDGGAHVDANLEEYYKVLCSGEWGLGITGNLTFDGPPPFPQGVTIYPQNGHFSLVRQFAHEFLNTVDKLRWCS